ncbi:PTS transporter subunit EIIC [[Mycoplasma] testudinis]|uniref:PTS transporter subunit EIIC n=1 Tax=[Mycoplasma] testudinis TaxID=33924 RepID=UPI000698F87A|nr:PTS transporter subunit EIIC [[Mycoplasma] testudinis]
MAKPKDIAASLNQCIDAHNINSITHCMTRLRIKFKDPNAVDTETIKKVDGVLGLVKANEEYQIVIGPAVRKVFEEFSAGVKKMGIDVNTSDTPIEENLDPELAAKAKEKEALNLSVAGQDLQAVSTGNKSAIRNRFVGKKIQEGLAKFAKVFAPLIPAFIAAGILSGIAGIIQTVVASTGPNPTATGWQNFFDTYLSVWRSAFLVVVGWRFAEIFGGKGWLGGIIGAAYTSLSAPLYGAMWVPPAGTISASSVGHFLGIPVSVGDLDKFWLTSGLVTLGSNGIPNGVGTPHGSIFGVFLAATASIYIERYIGKVIPGLIDAVVTPFLSLLVILFVNFFIIIPISGYLFLGVTWLFRLLTNSPFGTMVLSGIFIIAVTFGIHQGFVPIYVALVADTGINALFPVLAMGGASQVGTAIALWFVAKKGSALRKQIQGAIIPGILGIGEPLIYGVTLPRLAPYITSCLGAVIPGFFIGAINVWGGANMGLNSVFGPSGVLAIPLITSTTNGQSIGIGIYVAALIIAYIFGALFTFGGYFLTRKSKKFDWKLNS